MEKQQLTLAQLAEAHLMNVQREISALNNEKSKIDAEIQRLTEYLNNGIDVIRQSQVKTVQNPMPKEAVKEFFGGE
jgi:hypothetical protein